MPLSQGIIFSAVCNKGLHPKGWLLALVQILDESATDRHYVTELKTVVKKFLGAGSSVLYYKHSHAPSIVVRYDFIYSVPYDRNCYAACKA
jgi:hypothetical protein